MARIYLCMVVLLTFVCFGSNNVVRSVQSFVDHELIPDILSTPPGTLLSVIFPNGVEALEGNELTPDEVIGMPKLQWRANPDCFYTVIMCDADTPSRATPEARSFLHWLVVNVPGDNVTAGETIVNILNSHPEPQTGLHRYVFLVYEQTEERCFDVLPNESFEGRVAFSPEEFSLMYNFGAPIAGNFYQTQTVEDTLKGINNFNHRIRNY